MVGCIRNHGVQFGVQFQGNSKALRNKKMLQISIFTTHENPLQPAGGRAVAGSNPVSPTSEEKVWLLQAFSAG
jgi:hypothetical protein